MSKLYITIGLIGSGKSTWAKKFAIENPNTKIVSGDDLREMFAGYYLYDINFESILPTITRQIIVELLAAGYDVVLDECNLSRSNRELLVTSLNGIDCTAVVFVPKSKEWHLNNRYKHLRGYTFEQWDEVFDKHIEIFNRFNEVQENYFDEIIYV